MVRPTKILTVSYGTFSCTLEGFDDSFGTMKAIAGYFRDLTAEDRYFGAEPPKPDAQRMAAIAGREISRRVNFRTDDSGIVLQATSTAEHARADAQEEAAADEQTARLAGQVEAQAEDDAAFADAQRTDLRSTHDVFEFKETAQGLPADLTSDESSPDVSTPADASATPDPFEPDVLAQNSSVFVADMPIAEPVSDLDDKEDTVAAKLKRIREAARTSKNALSDDLSAQFLPQKDAPDVADVADETPDVLVPDLDTQETAPDTVQDTTANAARSEPESPSAPAIEAGDESTSDREPDPTDETFAPAQSETEASETQARILRMNSGNFENVMNPDAASATPRQEPILLTNPNFAMLDGAEELANYFEDSDFSDEAAAKQEAGSQEEPNATGTTEGQGNGADAADPQTETAAGETATSRTPRAAREDSPTLDDAALDRLMSKTNSQMKDPESSRRRNAIAQLKAAVAAKEAARQVGEADENTQDVENAFRNDLSKAVRPVDNKADIKPADIKAADNKVDGIAPRPRPVLGTVARTQRPRPAPLKLVASQRIDVPAPKQRDTPVIPRRVAARADDAAQTSEGSFAEFAKSMGASDLPDLLEAAAAYSAFVEGADEFSRPQVLRRVRAVAHEDFNREDGLRSFAELLRSGRFTKVRNGRFQVSDDSRFNPEQRAG